jgi:hypothetical protein
MGSELGAALIKPFWHSDRPHEPANGAPQTLMFSNPTLASSRIERRFINPPRLRPVGRPPPAAGWYLANCAMLIICFCNSRPNGRGRLKRKSIRRGLAMLIPRNVPWFRIESGGHLDDQASGCGDFSEMRCDRRGRDYGITAHPTSAGSGALRLHSMRLAHFFSIKWRLIWYSFDLPYADTNWGAKSPATAMTCVAEQSLLADLDASGERSVECKRCGRCQAAMSVSWIADLEPENGRA